MAIRDSVETICMIYEGYRTHRDVTGPMSFKKSGGLLSENRAPEILGPLSAIQALLLTFQTLLWLLNV